MSGDGDDAGWAVTGNRLANALRLLLGLVLLEAALWAPPALSLISILLALSYMVFHLRRLADPTGAGLSLRNLLNGAWLLAPTLALAAVILTTARYNGSLHRLWGLEHPWTAVILYTAWAFVQQFMLQCFCLRLLRALFSRVGSLLGAAAVFAVAHLPNPGLMLITFIAGIGLSALYARKRNLVLVAAIHAVLGLTLAVSAPDDWLHGLRVGRDFSSQTTLAAVVGNAEAK